MLTTCKKLDSFSKDDTVKQGPSSGSSILRYRDIVFDSSAVIVTRDIVYRTINDYAFGDTIKRNLLLDFYEPAGDTTQKRPLVILIHGGGFYTGFLSWMEEIARYLVRYGYCVANIDYRVDPTILTDTIFESDNRTIARIYTAIYRVNQDARFAIRYCKSN
jgi:acetyl esterase/lipase